MGEAQWYLSWEEFKDLPLPSLKHTTFEEELESRRYGTEFIEKLGLALGLSQWIISTAQVFFHRFYLRESFKRFSFNDMTLTMVFLAAKVEDSPRKLRDVILKGLSIRFKGAEIFSEASPEYSALYDRILRLEKTALVTLCFDLTIDHPFRHVARIFNSYPEKFDSEFKKRTWSLLTKSFSSPLPILFPSRVLALSLLIFEVSKSNFYNLRNADDFIAYIGQSGDNWNMHFSKVTQEDVEAAIKFFQRKDLPFSL